MALYMAERLRLHFANCRYEVTKVDKNEYNLRLEEIDAYVSQGNYSEAAKAADTIDWRRVRNVRTLCMISEIYEADHRYEDSKALLLRAYRRSPVGRAILYRLVEVTIQLKQFDEAIEYYSEYVQAAPHDNNKYILKYKIYKGRGSSLDEQIDILKEYLSQEYTEKWAYELAKLYQQADRIPECLAACDDLVLWFHSGKYVIKALELKRRYTALTPKQQEIYDHRFDEAAPEGYEDETRLGQEKQIVETTEDKLAETILEDAQKEIAQSVAQTRQEESSPSEGKKEDRAETADQDTDEAEVSRQGADKAEADGQEADEAAGSPFDEPVKDAKEFDEELNKYNTQDLQTELVKSMREIIYGVGGRREESDMPDPEDSVIQQSKQEQEAGMDSKEDEPSLKMPSRMQFQAKTGKPSAGKLSIDDILLSMGERGDAVREAAAKAAAGIKAPANGVVSAMDEALIGMGVEVKKEPEAPEKESIAEAVAKGVGSAVERLGQMAEMEELPGMEETLETGNAKESKETFEDLATAKTRRIPTDEIAEIHASFGLDEDGRRVNFQTEEQEPEKGQAEVERFPKQGRPGTCQRTETAGTVPPEMAPMPGEENPRTQSFTEESGAERPLEGQPQKTQDSSKVSRMERPAGKRQRKGQPSYGNGPRLKDYQRDLFAGFLEIQNMESQIASAILQAGQKGEDRTSRTGNVLIFGGHGCGKTTIATGLAKAIAQEKGNQFVKMAKIYASDFNRKDIASTIAKIAGGTLIIEEAGDLEDGVVDQLTTAMEFRTDGLIIILEDEQKYLHDLLMRHPRFTMKFTAQIFIPVFTIDELVNFGEIYAGDQDYVFSDAAAESLYERIGAVAAQGEAISITNVIELVDRAIHKSNKFFRKLTAGRSRYDENNCIVLQEKDFR